MINIEKEFESPTYLYEPLHIYLDKKTNYFYNSVTGALHYFEEDFDSYEISKRVQVYHDKFLKWYKSLTSNMDAFFPLYDLFVQYRKYRDYELKEWNGEPYKAYKKIQEYSSIEELEAELKYLAQIYPLPKKGFNRYISEDYTVFSIEKMLTFWDDLNNIANIYGSLVHTIIEWHVLNRQNLLPKKQENLYEVIYDLYLELSQKYDLLKTRYVYHLPFEAYNIPSFKDFFDHIIEEYDKLPVDWGELVVPEKILGYKNLKGMTDKYILLNLNSFHIGDHKTNKEFNEESEYFQKMKYPFHKYDQCEANTYTFQLNIYANMDEYTTGRKCEGLWIDYYDRDKNAFVLKEIERKKDEADYIINHYFEWIKKKKELYLSSNLAECINEYIKPEWMDVFIKKLDADILEKKKEGGFKNKKEGLSYYMNFTKEFYKKHKNIKYELIKENL